MKNSIVLFLAIFCFSVACKKDGTKVTRFIPTFKEGVIQSDSISYAIINYSDVNEIKDTLDLMNPDVFSHTVKVSNPFSLSLTDEHFYVLKKFDLFDKSGSLLYYMPYRTQLNYHEGITLPFSFKAMNRTLELPVIKKN
jgi:hypothetical protein